MKIEEGCAGVAEDRGTEGSREVWKERNWMAGRRGGRRGAEREGGSAEGESSCQRQRRSGMAPHLLVLALSSSSSSVIVGAVT